MRRNLLYKLCSLACAVLCILPIVSAQFEEGIVMHPVIARPILTGNALTDNPQAVNVNPYDNQGENTADITHIITLKILENNGVYFKTNFTATVQLDLEIKDAANNTTNQPCTLTVHYDKVAGAKYAVRDYKVLKGYHEVKVTVTHINISGNLGWDPKQVLEVENEMRITRYYTLSNTASDLVPTFTITQPTLDVLQVGWHFPLTAHENMTQLEWAYVEEEMLDFYNGDYEAIFKNNSTRIDLDYNADGYSFKIPLLYPRKGKLYYRSRAVYRKVNGTLITGLWSTVSETANSFDIIEGHDERLNWQSSTNFAEGGKYKTVIQYFDGSLRGRQTVTKDNSTGNTVVSETIYDLQGRPNIQILPTPTIDKTIKYFESFNRFTDMSANGDPAKYFDLTPDNLKCAPSPALDNAFGNGRYYSQNNDWLTGTSAEPKSKFIPDANGYGYTETRFTDDATQRVKLQGGVGIDHQIGKGHETKYYYGKPSQPELDALFGTEAGDASHYSKNMVQDANGQMSVSYVDMHGRTVATALAGEPSDGMDGIQNDTDDYPMINPAASATVRDYLVTAATNIVKDNTITSVSTILTPALTDYKFTYELNPEILQLLNCDDQTICYDCKYDLEISIKGEDCGGQYETAIIRKYSNLQLVPANQACSTSMGFIGEQITVPVKQFTFYELLQTGSYTVRKTLTINNESLQARKEQAINELLCKKQEDIYDSVLAVLTVATGCGSANPVQAACDECMLKLGGSFPEYKASYLSAIAPATATDAVIQAQYDTDLQECSIVCGTGVNPSFATLTGLRRQMLRDMTPYTGQYTTKEIQDADYTRLESKYNIFSAGYKTSANGSLITTGRPLYKYPMHENGQLKYLDESGEADNNIGGSGQTMTGVTEDEFAGSFQESWAASLIKYHPEYSKLQYAETTMKPAYDWLDQMLQWKTYAGFPLPVSEDGSTVNDPYFTLPGTASDKAAIINKLYHSVSDIHPGPSIWQIANSTVICSTMPDNDGKYDNCFGNVQFNPKNGIAPSITADADKDKVWEKFKTLYTSYRNEMVLKYINTHASNVLSQADMDRLSLDEDKQLVFASQQDIANQNGWTWWSEVTSATETSDMDGILTTVNNYIESTDLDNCESQRPLWKARLQQCETLKALLESSLQTNVTKANDIIDEILDGLVEVCHNSITAQQINGASTVNPSYTGSPRSFEEVINNVFNATGNNIHTLPGNNYFCNPFTIDVPKPFGLNPPLVVNHANELNTCNCDRFDALKAEAAALAVNTSSFTEMNEFLNENYHEELTVTVWEGLQQCGNIMIDTCPRLRPSNIRARSSQSTNSSTPSCAYCELAVDNRATNGHPDEYVAKCEIIFHPNFKSDENDDFVAYINPDLADCNSDPCIVYNPIRLPEFAVIPAFLNCGYVKPCITCSTLVNVLTPAFRTLYPAYQNVPYVNTSTITSAQIQENELWARFINFRTGFSKAAIDYIEAYKNCDVATPPQYALCSFDKPANDPSDVYPSETNPCKSVETQAKFISQLLFEKRKEYLLAEFERLYIKKCLNAQYIEKFYVDYKPSEYHYTLYYYDQAGNLVKTLPPAAVKPNYDADYLSEVITARSTLSSRTNENNNELLRTQYCYNSLNQVVTQRAPDAGVSNFFYDRLGRLVVSQNEKQAPNRYSYTLYDELGRMTEVGEKPHSTPLLQSTSQVKQSLENWLAGGSLKEQITRTVYDVSYYAGEQLPLLGPVLQQQNLRNRVSYSQVINQQPANGNYAGVHASATYYSYDVHGNVDELVQDFGDQLLQPNVMNTTDNRFKKIEYNYDLISGKVNQVSFQAGFTDQFYHKYGYDDENRIVKVETSHDNIVWEKDAVYEYYRHGPLSRTELGENRVQGMDYAYSIQGWLKGVNSTSVAGGLFDMGGDGKPNSLNSSVAGDVYGYSLNYFNSTTGGDYTPIGGAAINPFVAVLTNLQAAETTNPVETGRNLFNGNIRAMMVNIPTLGTASLYGYRYDQLNRIKAMNSYGAFNNSTNLFTNNTPGVTQDYKERISYDPNGNIRKYERNGDAVRPYMDDMTYSYKPNTNQLDKVTDAAPDAATTVYDKYNDIKKFKADGITPAQANGNYTYDAIGNLIADASEGITNIEWTVYGKIESITKDNGAIIRYTYDASGNRISKTVTEGTGTPKTSVYVRDASGNVIGIYQQDPSLNSGNLTQTEVQLYGNSRLGVWNIKRDVSSLAAIDYSNYSATFIRGNKFFELSNHLGNVLVTISDKKIGVDASSPVDGIVDHYTGDVVTANDYYPGGMQMPGRSYTSGNQYRYGFNGKEKDNETYGEGNVYDYGFRIYNPRIGRFLSVDPISAKYPELTPYQFASNRPIDGIDLDGLEYLSFNSSMYKLGITAQTSEITLLTVYENIPTQLQDPQTCGLKFSGYGPLNNDGTEYDPLKQSMMLYDHSRYNRESAPFNGARDGTTTNGINSLKGNAIPGVTSQNGDNPWITQNVNADNVNSIGNILGANGARGILENAWNYLLPWSEQAGLNEEAEKRFGFRKAVEGIDNRVINGILPTGIFPGTGELITPPLRAGIINFMTDGTVDFENPGNSIKAAWYGIQILRNSGISIQDKTKQSLNLLLDKYKKSGGGSEYDTITQYYEDKDE